MKAALAQVLGAPWQRCTVHFLRDLRGHVRRDQHDALGAIIRSIFTAPDDVDAHRHRAPSPHTPQVLDERGERRRGVVDAAAEHDRAVATLDCLHPMEVLGDVDADRDSLHASSSTIDDDTALSFPSLAYKAIDRGA